MVSNSIKVEEVADNVFKLVLPFPQGRYVVLSYLTRGEDGCAVVDAGWGTRQCLDEFNVQLKHIGVKISEIKHIVMTHSHPDHCGLAWELRKQSGARVAIHINELPFLRERYGEPERFLEKMREWLFKYGVPSNELKALPSTLFPSVFPIGEPDITLRGGETLEMAGRKIIVKWTPGHTYGHICLYDVEHRLIYTGDHMLPDITPNISLSRHYEEGDPLGDYLASLKETAEIDADLVLPGHEYPFRGLKKRVRELVRHHQERLEEVLNMVENGRTAWQIAEHVTWSIGHFHDFEPFEKRRALGETLAHLRYLERGNRVESRVKEGQVVFRKL